MNRESPVACYRPSQWGGGSVLENFAPGHTFRPAPVAIFKAQMPSLAAKQFAARSFLLVRRLHPARSAPCSSVQSFFGQLPKSQWRRLGPVRQITHPGAAAIAKRCYTNPAVSGPLCATPHGMEGIVAGGGRECKKVLGQGRRVDDR